MWFVRREFLQLAGGVIAVFSHSARAQTQAGAPSPIEVLRSDLLGQDHKVMETLVTVVTFPPGSVSRWHVHPGAQELLFVSDGRLTLEVDGRETRIINAGEASIIPADTAHQVKNNSTDLSAKSLVVFSRSAKDKPLLVRVTR